MPAKKKEPDCSLAPLTRTYAMEAESQFMPTISGSLLESSCGGQYPEDADAPRDLVAIVRRSPGLYATFLGKIIAGSSFRAACLSVGLYPNRFRNWLSQGSADLADDYDSFCARLLLDCQRAASIAVSDAEERVHRGDPSKWLSRSATGKEFNKGIYWQEQVKGITQDMPPDDDTFDPPPLRPAVEAASEDTSQEAVLGEALKVLEGFQIATDPEFVKQAKAQYRLEDKRDG